VLAAACLGALLCFLNLSALNVVLPAVGRSLQASPAQASWILLSYMLVSTVCILSFGRLADLWGLVRLLRIAPISREMILNFVAQQSLGLPKSY